MNGSSINSMNMPDKRLLFVLVVQFIFYKNFAQQSYSVGFTDTVIYAAQKTFKGESYEGPAPVFVQIWFPDTLQEGVKLRIGGFRNINVPDTLSATYESLANFQKQSIVEYALTYQLGSYEQIDYGGISAELIYQYFGEIESQSHRSAILAKGVHDVIVYHHGTLGNPQENAGMAEYFARHGYIFISASYHLPNKDIPFGWEAMWNDLILEREVMKFSKQLAEERNVFFIGHSWGAQLGWCLLHEEGLADGFVSLETTMEFKTDLAEIREKWPHMLKLQSDSTVRYEVPILALASADVIKPMLFFRTLDYQRLTEVIVPTSFDHEAFTSQYMLRGEIGHDVPVPDRSAIEESRKIYDQMLDLILKFFKSVQSDKNDSASGSVERHQVRMMNIDGEFLQDHRE